MIVYNNKEYRNLVEQVEKNKADIEDWNAKEDTLANFGIKIIGKVQSVDQLPDVADYDYGDAYMVGSDETADYNYYLATRPTAEVAEKHWQNIGKLSITGPEGPKGDEIVKIEKTLTEDKGDTIVYGRQTNNTITVTMNDGRTMNFVVTTYAKQGLKGDQGIQGIQGEKGDKGDKGDTGEQGPQGEMGPTAPAYHIVGTVTSTSQLPDPALLKDLSAAYIVEEDSVKKLYIQTGLSIEVAVWEYLGELSASNYWELSNKILAPVETVDTVQIKKLAVLNAGGLSCSSPSISGVASCSAINSPSSSLTLSGKDGVEILANGTKYLDIRTNGVFMPNLSTSSVSADQPILFAKSEDGWITKASGITGNPVTGELKTTKLTTTGTITSSGELIFPQDTTYTANTCGIIRYSNRLLLGDLGNGVSISKIGNNESIIKQVNHSGEWTYVLPDTAGNMLSYQEKTSTEEYNRLNHEITLPVQKPSDSQASGYRHISGAIGRYYIDQFISAYVNLSAYYNKAELTVSGSQQPVCIEFFKNNTSTTGCRMTCKADVFIVVDQDRDYNYYGTINIWCPTEGKFYSSSYGSGHLVIYSTNGAEFNIRGDLYTDKTIITRNSLPSWYSKSGTSEVNVSYTALLASSNTFTGLNTFTGTIKANSIMDNVNNQVIKGSSFRLGAGTYTLQTLLKMVFTTIPSNYMVTINCPSGSMTTKDEDIGTYSNVHYWNYDNAGYQAVDYYDANSYVHDEDKASTDTSKITVTCTEAIQVIISC